MSQFTTIIFDIGDVLFSWSSETKTSISSRTLRCILNSPTWFDYERGRIDQDACYARLAAEFSIDPAEIGRAFDQARESLRCNEKMITLIRDLKCHTDGPLRVFAMSNISLPDYSVLRTKPADWAVFDRVYTSCGAGQRKPNLAFYRQVIADTGLNPKHTIFVDDKLDNVISARSLGFHGIVFDDEDKVIRALRNLMGDPVLRGRQFLQLNACKHHSVINNGTVLKENFAQLLILEMTNDRSLVDLVEHPRAWNFFQGQPLFTTEQFPFDLDTTSVGFTVTSTDEDTILSVMDEMLQYIDDDGIIQTYFDHNRPRFDPTVCVNVLTLFYTYGRGSELYSTLQWVHDVLLNRAYLEGSRYYTTSECFLFFLSRLLRSSDSEELHQMIFPLLKLRVRERIGAEGDALALAMRILTCVYVGWDHETIRPDLRKLLELQQEDGGWGDGWMYKYGSSGLLIGNRGLTTAMAVRAVEAMKRPKLPTLVVEPPSPKLPSPTRLFFHSALKHMPSASVSSTVIGDGDLGTRPDTPTTPTTPTTLVGTLTSGFSGLRRRSMHAYRPSISTTFGGEKEGPSALPKESSSRTSFSGLRRRSMHTPRPSISISGTVPLKSKDAVGSTTEEEATCDSTNANEKSHKQGSRVKMSLQWLLRSLDAR